MEQPNKQAAPEVKKGLVDQAGEILEKVGHKISDLGAKDLGQKIHDAGDRMEKTHTDPSHPDKV